MNLGESLNELAMKAGTLGRGRCIAELRQLNRPKIDFADDFLHSKSLDQLRHIVMAAWLQAGKP